MSKKNDWKGVQVGDYIITPKMIAAGAGGLVGGWLFGVVGLVAVPVAGLFAWNNKDKIQKMLEDKSKK